MYSGTVRLSPGPIRQTSLSIVPAPENNEHRRQRAISSGSQATVCSVEGGLSQTTSLGLGSATSPESIISASQLEHRKDNDGRRTSNEETEDAEMAKEQSLRFGNITLDGCVEITPAASPAHSHDVSEDVPVSRRDVPVLREIHSDAFPTTTPHQQMPGLLSSARARRRHARSHGTSIPQDPVELQHFIQDRHVSRLPSHTSLVPVLPPPVPELMLPDGTDGSRDIGNPFLDPGAPVFVPRTRFGTVAGSSNDSSLGVSLEPQRSNLDSAHNSSNLRLRSSSEQNVDPVSRHRAQVQRPETAQPRHRRRSRVSDQNEPLPVLDRYPLLRPNLRPQIARRSSVAHRPARFPGRRATRISSVSSHALPSTNLSFAASGNETASDGREYFASQEGTSMEDVNVTEPHVLPRPSPEPLITSRSSSLHWREHITPPHRVPSIVSAASGISRALSSSDYSGKGMSAADEFLQMRNSPLDELMERLSRLSGSRPRSVGRSWERPPTQRPRPSLLNGNPFRQEPSATSQDNFTAISSPLSMSASAIFKQESGSIAHDAPDSSVAPLTSPATDLAMQTPAITPIQHPIAGTMCSPRRPLANTLPGKAQSSPGRSGCVAPSSPTMATPRVKVYDDAQLAVNQPQTPADVGRSSHRSRGCSDVVTQVSVAAPSTVPLSSPPIPRHQNRHTYPSTAATATATHASPPAQALHALRNAATSAAQQILQHTRIHRHRPSSDENAEHDLDAFEGERRVWAERQDAGTLHSTPPGEGRLERYMS